MNYDKKRELDEQRAIKLVGRIHTYRNSDNLKIEEKMKMKREAEEEIDIFFDDIEYEIQESDNVTSIIEHRGKANL